MPCGLRKHRERAQWVRKTSSSVAALEKRQRGFRVRADPRPGMTAESYAPK